MENSDTVKKVPGGYYAPGQDIYDPSLDKVKVTADVPEEHEEREVLPSLSEEEVREMFHKELEGKLDDDEEDEISEEFNELADLQERTVNSPEEPPKLKTNNGLIELDDEPKQEAPPDVSPQPKKVEETEDERLERLRNVARENLKKK